MTISNAAVSASIQAILSEADPTSDLGDSAGAWAKSVSSPGTTFADGTGAGQADQVFGDQRTLGVSASEDLDLAGVLTDALGNTLTMARVKAILIKSADTNTVDLTIGAGTNPWVGLLNAAGTITLRPGAWFCSAVGAADATGMVVTATTGDILQVVNGAASSTYDIVIIAASA